MRPVRLSLRGPPRFPPAAAADREGFVAFGGDLSPERLLLAYDSGIFPWYEEGLPPLWWSPDPRAVFRPETLHVSRRLARRLRQGVFTLTWDREYAAVVDACAAREEGTWLTRDMRRAYLLLHRLGSAHSLEVWQAGDLVGGLYGVHRGGLFAAESMFHRATDASKAALVAGVRSLHRAGIRLFDVQMPTPHLTSMGAETWPRARYLEAVANVRAMDVDLRGPELSFEP